MKKNLLCGAVLLSALLFAGCKRPGKGWDFFNTYISISVYNSAGINLLHAGRPETIINNNIRIEYGGESYPLKKTRAKEIDLPDWNGLTLSGDNESMLFGEFSADTKDYRGETFTIHWGDGTSDEVKFDLYAVYSGDADPVVVEKIWLNGTLQSENSLKVIITK